MVAGVQDRIVEVRDFLQTRLTNIHDIQAHPDNLPVMQAMLYSSFIDALGATRYGSKVDTRERFTRVIIEYGNWLEAQYVCPMHLQRFLEISPGLPVLKQHIDVFVDKWRADLGGIIFLDKAPTIDEIAEFWPDNGSGKHHKKTLDHFTHVNLLYGMRNGLLHQQYAAKGLPLFPKEQNNVHYVFWNRNDEGERLELIHPPKFLASLCNTLLDNVMNDFEAKNKKPWDIGHFPNYLIDGL
ncbi:hypothetical protein WD345_002574 [Vibrio parahaemolyticus]